VATERFRPQPVGGHYLVLSELVSHKQIDVAIEAFNRLRLPLVVTGGGPDGRRLRRLGGPTIRFAGRVSDAEAARLLASSRALVVTTGEEFGIAAVEAQAAGRPVIARAAGGLLENVIDGVTGCLWEGGPDELAEAVTRFDTSAVDAGACIANARRFDSSVFRQMFPREVEAALHEGPTDRQETWPRIPRRPTPSRRPAWRASRFGG
jgi:glycosyltransferase involved in cell wall biosynthesis